MKMSKHVTDADFHLVVSIYQDMLNKARICKEGRLHNLCDNIQASKKALAHARIQVDDLPTAIAHWESDIRILKEMTDDELIRDISDLAKEKASR